MFRGSSAIPGPSSSGRPRSVLPNTSRARVPAAWPTCMPKTAPPSWRIICPPRSAPWVLSATTATGAWVRGAVARQSAPDALVAALGAQAPDALVALNAQGADLGGQMMRQLGGAVFGMQVGQAAGTLARE